MKIMRLSNGLGNAMFQYATYLQLKKMYPREKVYVDTIWYDYTGVPYELDQIFHLNTDKIDFHKLLAQKHGISFEERLEELRYWKKEGYSSWIEVGSSMEYLSFIELPQLYLPYAKDLRIQSSQKVTIYEWRDAFIKNHALTAYDFLTSRGKTGCWIRKHCDNIVTKYLLAGIKPTRRKKIISDILKGKKPDLTEYPSLEGLRQKGNVYFNMYGAPSHTIGIEEELYAAFVFPELISEETINMAKLICDTESVAIHARCGDSGIFLKDVIKRNYYKKAVFYLKKKTNQKLTFFIFSDDLDWCKQNVHLLGVDCKSDEVHFVQKGDDDENYRDMQLISMCKHAVIPNSTFSWWGCFLNKNPQKIIITPYGTLSGTISL